MLTKICEEINNWFDIKRVIGKFTISGGSLILPEKLRPNQYYRIIGSLYNDGVHSCDDVLEDEEFDGAVWYMAMPDDVIKLSTLVAEYEDTNKPTPYTSESFAGYAYSKATNAVGAPIGWRKVFAEELNRWRKIKV